MDFAVVARNLPYMLNGLWLTIVISLVSMTGSLAGGVVLAVLRRSRILPFYGPAVLYIELIRSTPLLMVIFWFYFLLPVVTGQNLAPLAAGIVAMIAFQSAYVAEIVRAGIQSVQRGQLEAALATGLSYLAAMRHVVLPQALRNMLPALVARFVALFKSTSLLYIIGVIEFFRAATIVNSREFRSEEIFLFVAALYFCCGSTISYLGRRLERRLAVEHAGLLAYTSTAT
jgi:His/Glu/Gln/Arg/opine family amino acid ABC transporter permease subunit